MRHIAPEKMEAGQIRGEKGGEMGGIRGRVEVVGSYEDWGVSVTMEREEK